jgi:hypothetical protein
MNMAASDVSDTLQVALQASGLDQVKVLHRPRLLSDNGPSYVSNVPFSTFISILVTSATRRSRSEPAAVSTAFRAQIKTSIVPPVSAHLKVQG